MKRIIKYLSVVIVVAIGNISCSSKLQSMGPELDPGRADKVEEAPKKQDNENEVTEIPSLFSKILFFPGDAFWFNNENVKLKVPVIKNVFYSYPWLLYADDLYGVVSQTGMCFIEKFSGFYDADGFITYKQTKNTEARGHNAYLVSGANYYIVQLYYEASPSHELVSGGFVNTYGNDGGFENSYVEEFLSKDFKNEANSGSFAGYLLDDGIQSVSASSSLAESAQAGGFVYSPEKMLKKYAFIDHPEGGSMEYRNYLRCWAEGVDGPGIGEYVDIVFSRDSDRLIVLNGYVDILRRYLYKDNSRPKIVELRSESPEFIMEYEFEDVVKFHEIVLPAPTSSLRLTIKDVYPGRKYDDTCVSAVMLPQERWRSEDEERAELFAYLVEIGAWETIRAELEASQ